MAEELTFHLEEFEGPLELLLALVSKHKMDLHNIPMFLRCCKTASEECSV